MQINHIDLLADSDTILIVQGSETFRGCINEMSGRSYPPKQAVLDQSCTSQLNPGDRVVSRLGKHAIYLGNQEVVTYFGTAVASIPIHEFTKGRDFGLQPRPDDALDPADTVARARSRIGENRFHSINNNDRQFCDWCLTGKGTIPDISKDPLVESSDSLFPALGDHLKTPRNDYYHHGIYIGHNKVIHYSGFARGFCKGPIQETTLTDFAWPGGQPEFNYAYYENDQVGCLNGYYVLRMPQGAFDREAIIERARSRLGEADYSLFRNNCEHFAHWCVTGNAVSHQVQSWVFKAATGVAGVAVWMTLASGLLEPRRGSDDLSIFHDE